MYVCLCHAITDRDIRGQAEGGNCTVAGVYKSRGVAPQCGRCVATVRDVLRSSVSAAKNSMMSAGGAFCASAAAAPPTA